MAGFEVLERRAVARVVALLVLPEGVDVGLGGLDAGEPGVAERPLGHPGVNDGDLHPGARQVGTFRWPTHLRRIHRFGVLTFLTLAAERREHEVLGSGPQGGRHLGQPVEGLAHAEVGQLEGDEGHPAELDRGAGVAAEHSAGFVGVARPHHDAAVDGEEVGVGVVVRSPGGGPHGQGHGLVAGPGPEHAPPHEQLGLAEAQRHQILPLLGRTGSTVVAHLGGTSCVG